MVSYKIPNKSICVGNLSIGGTGKSPHVDYIAKLLIDQKKKVATLSRGYGRKTKGFLEVKSSSTANDVGDEPLMFKIKNGDSLNVVVCEDRTEGVRGINELHPDTELIILDDAMQHRRVSAGMNIVLTDYARPYFEDFILPIGNLRESKTGIVRADAIIVTKCPDNLNDSQKDNLRSKINLPGIPVFFSAIQYGKLSPVGKELPKEIDTVLVVSGIANPSPLIEHLQKSYKVEHLCFKDHHNFSAADIEQIHKKFDSFATRKKAIITTEKDYMRLKEFDAIYAENYHWAFQPIEILLDEQEKFNTLINTYAN